MLSTWYEHGHGKENKDGRHVGLDFYDLLIEARYGQSGTQDRKPLATRPIYWDKCGALASARPFSDDGDEMDSLGGGVYDVANPKIHCDKPVERSITSGGRCEKATC